MPLGTYENAGLPPAADTMTESTFPNVAGSCSSVGAAVLRAAVKLATGTPLSCTWHRPRQPRTLNSMSIGCQNWQGSVLSNASLVSESFDLRESHAQLIHHTLLLRVLPVQQAMHNQSPGC